MDKLKQFIEDHYEPEPLEKAPDFTWEGISERLDELEGKKKKGFILNSKILLKPWAAAAAVLLLLVAGIGLWLPSDTGANFATQYPELAETEQFYQQVLQEKETQIQERAGNEVYQEEIDLLEEEYRALRESLNEHTNNEEIIRSMIENYRLRVDLLEGLLEQLKEQEPNNNETYS
ncbi:MAG: hypothetical protein AAF740_08600 [Bacteroidota bacterium]